MLKGADILVCSDFTQGSDLAMRAAETLRERIRGPLHVLHVNEYPLHWESPMKELMSKRMDEKFELELLSESEGPLSIWVDWPLKLSLLLQCRF